MELQLDVNKEYGVVLEGGGAKGAYQVGAWKALKEAGIRIKGIAGTSVGALNGALMCMDDYERAESLWTNITYSQVLSVDDQMIEGLKNFDVKSLNFSDVLQDVKQVFADRGLDITPLKELLAQEVDEERIRNSDRELFVTTLSVTDRKELNIDVREMPEGAMKDALLASAFLPGFKSEKLGGKVYMDGGSVNNVPINVLTDRGYKDVIVIRIYGVGVDREKFFNLPKDVNIYRIAPAKSLGGTLAFDSRKTKRNLELGYYDAMRMLYGLLGRKYYLDLPMTEGYYFEKLMAEAPVIKKFLRFEEKRLEPGILDKDRLSGCRLYTERIFPLLAKRLKLPSKWDYRDLYGAVLEVCAKKLDMKPMAVYGADEIMEAVLKAMETVGIQEDTKS